MLNRLRDFYQTSAFARNVATVFSGNTIAIIIPFVLAPFIARIYSPADFAGFELFVKILALVSVIASLRLELAILLPTSEIESDGLVKLSIQFLIVFTLISCVFIPFRHEIGALLQNDSIPDLLWLFPLGLFVTGMLNVLNQWLIRQKRFKELASNKVVAATGTNCTKYFLGIESASSMGLVIGHILGIFIPLIALFRLRGLRKMILSLAKNSSSPRRLILKYRDFPVVSSFHSFFDEAQKALLVFFISAYYGELIFGLFAFTLRYLRVPVQVFGHSLAQVLNEKLARDHNEGRDIRAAVKKTMGGLAAVSIIPFALITFYGSEIFAIVFSEEWRVAGTYAQYLAPWLFLNFAITPVSMVPLIMKKQRQFLTMSVIGNLITLIAVFWLAIEQFHFRYILIAVSATYAMLLLYQAFWFVAIAKPLKLKSTNQHMN